MTYQPILEHAEQLLTDKHQRIVKLGEPETLRSQNATVLKVPVVAGMDNETNVIIKIVGEDDQQQQRFHTEWVALQLLDSLAEDAPVAPHFYGADDDLNFFIIEDMTNPTTLTDIFRGDSPDDAQAALNNYGKSLATMHGITRGHEATRAQAYDPFGHDGVFPIDSAVDMRPHMERIQASFNSCNITIDDKFVAELNHVAASLLDDSPFRTLVHHDAGCHNVLLSDGQAYLIDFEFAHYNHALIDVAAVRMGFPPFMWGQPIPDDVVTEFEATYRETLAQYIPEANDKQQFIDGLLCACAQYALVKFVGGGDIMVDVIIKGDLSKKPDDLPEEHIEWYRKWIYSQQNQFVKAANEFRLFPAMRATSEQVMALFDQYHPDLEQMPVYPAFAK